MLLLLLIIIIITGLLLITMILVIIFYYLSMAWLCRVTVFGLFWTSQLRCTHIQRHTIDETFSSPFLPRGICSVLSQNKSDFPVENHRYTCSSSSWRGNAVQKTERSSIFAAEVTVLFVRHGFEIFQTFQKPQNQLSYPPAHSHSGTFLILKLN